MSGPADAEKHAGRAPSPAATARLATIIKSLDQAKALVGVAWREAHSELAPLRESLAKIGPDIAAQAADARSALAAAQARAK